MGFAHRFWREVKRLPAVRILVPILYGLLATFPLTIAASALEDQGNGLLANVFGILMGIAVWHVMWSVRDVS